MKHNYLSNIAIKNHINDKLYAKHKTLDDCCNSFNNRYIENINKGDFNKINKDFLSRVLHGNFKIQNKRILKLCEFFDIQIDTKQSTGTRKRTNRLTKEILEFKEHVKKKPELESQFSSLLKFLNQITN